MQNATVGSWRDIAICKIVAQFGHSGLIFGKWIWKQITHIFVLFFLPFVSFQSIVNIDWTSRIIELPLWCVMSVCLVCSKVTWVATWYQCCRVCLRTIHLIHFIQRASLYIMKLSVISFGMRFIVWSQNRGSDVSLLLANIMRPTGINYEMELS